VSLSNPLENESVYFPRVGKKTKALMFLDRWAGIIDPATKYREFIATKNTKQILIGAAYKPPLFLCLFVAKIFAVISVHSWLKSLVAALPRLEPFLASLFYFTKLFIAALSGWLNFLFPFGRLARRSRPTLPIHIMRAHRPYLQSPHQVCRLSLSRFFRVFSGQKNSQESARETREKIATESICRPCTPLGGRGI